MTAGDRYQRLRLFLDRMRYDKFYYEMLWDMGIYSPMYIKCIHSMFKSVDEFLEISCCVHFFVIVGRLYPKTFFENLF